MKNQVAFVLSGGGSRGAMQVGALRALVEAGCHPDLVVGTSIGAVNGTFLAVHGFTHRGVENLVRCWEQLSATNMLPSNLWWQAMRLFLRPAKGSSQERVREFAIAQGLSPELRFRDISGARLYTVALDLNQGCPVVFGDDPDERVLDSMLASMAIPPWMAPLKRGERLLVDGGFVSNLPIETALDRGATEIIALDLFDHYERDRSDHGITPLVSKVNQTMLERPLHLELRLAESCGVPVKHVILVREPPVPFWDFRFSNELLEVGYRITQQAIAGWQERSRTHRSRWSEAREMLEDLLDTI